MMKRLCPCVIVFFVCLNEFVSNDSRNLYLLSMDKRGIVTEMLYCIVIDKVTTCKT